MTELDASPEQVATGPARVPAVLAGHRNPADLYRRLRIEQKITFLPTVVTAVSGAVDCFLHERMMVALHADWTAVPMALGMGTAGTGLAAGAMLFTLSRATAADELDFKRILLGALASGGVLTLVGYQPILVAAYLGLTAIATGKWHKARWQARRALKRALMSTEQEQPERKVLPVAKPKPQQPQQVVEADNWHEMLTEYIRRWNRGVSPSTATGSQLINPQLVDGRPVFTVDGGDKGIVLAEVNSKRELIAAALRLKLPDGEGKGGQDVVFDQPAGIGLDRGQLRLQIVDIDAVDAHAQRVTDDMSEVSPADNPYAVRIGSYIDDGSPVYHTLADEQGVWSGVIVAGTGMGKSSLVDALMYRARRRGFHTLFLDPQRGASSPIQARYATWPCLGVEMAVPALRFLEDAAEYRNNWLALHPSVSQILPGMGAPCVEGGEDPDPHCPCCGVVPPPIQAIVEECDQVFKALLPKSSVKLGEPYGVLAKIFRKLGMGFVVVTQLPEIGTFGGSDMLRSNLPIRNLLAMHVSSNTGGTLIPGLPYNPKLIPAVTGRALPCGPSARVMECVLDWLPRREKGRSGVPGPYAEDLYEALPPAVVHPADAAAAEHWFPQTADTLSLAREQARSAVAAILSGHRPETTPQSTAPVGESDMSWPEPVRARCTPPTPEELAAMAANASGESVVPGLVGEILSAIASEPGDAWLTFGDLARRIGRVPVDADNAELRARARDLSAELAGYAIPMRRRADGMSATVAEVRAALTGGRVNAHAA